MSQTVKKMLQPLDIVVALKLAVNDDSFTQAELANALGVSASQVNRSLRRCEASGLINREDRTVVRPALVEFLTHGARYAFPANLGAVSRGMPTAHATPSVADQMSPSDTVYVWPDPTGEKRGESVAPLYKTVTFAARRDSKLYEALALLDAIRVGRARERKLASTALANLVRQSHD